MKSIRHQECSPARLAYEIARATNGPPYHPYPPYLKGTQTVERYYRGDNVTLTEIQELPFLRDMLLSRPVERLVDRIGVVVAVDASNLQQRPWLYFVVFYTLPHEPLPQGMGHDIVRVWCHGDEIQLAQLPKNYARMQLDKVQQALGIALEPAIQEFCHLRLMWDAAIARQDLVA